MEDVYELFLHRVPTAPMCEELREKVLLSLEMATPDVRCPDFWAFRGEDWSYSLLGMLCMLEGFDVTLYEKNEQEIPCRDLLLSVGFSRYDLLALREIDGHSYDGEVLAARVEHYADTGERMDFYDELVDYDREQRVQ